MAKTANKNAPPINLMLFLVSKIYSRFFSIYRIRKASPVPGTLATINIKEAPPQARATNHLMVKRQRQPLKMHHGEI